MRINNSSTKVKSSKMGLDLKNLNFYPCDSSYSKYFASPKTINQKTNMFTSNFLKYNISKKSNNKQNKKYSKNMNENSVKIPKEDKNLINIRLNIKNQIINNNFDSKKVLNNESKINYENLLKEKDLIINDLSKKISIAKEKIGKYSENCNSLVNFIDKVDEQEYQNNNDFSETKSHSTVKKKESKEKNNNIISSFNPNNMVSKNVRKFFKDLILKNSKTFVSKPNSPKKVTSNNKKKKIKLSFIKSNSSNNSLISRSKWNSNSNNNNNNNNLFYNSLDLDFILYPNKIFSNRNHLYKYQTMNKSSSLVMKTFVPQSEKNRYLKNILKINNTNTSHTNTNINNNTKSKDYNINSVRNKNSSNPISSNNNNYYIYSQRNKIYNHFNIKNMSNNNPPKKIFDINSFRCDSKNYYNEDDNTQNDYISTTSLNNQFNQIKSKTQNLLCNFVNLCNIKSNLDYK